jgi:hypothetical protein
MRISSSSTTTGTASTHRCPADVQRPGSAGTYSATGPASTSTSLLVQVPELYRSYEGGGRTRGSPCPFYRSGTGRLHAASGDDGIRWVSGSSRWDDGGLRMQMDAINGLNGVGTTRDKARGAFPVEPRLGPGLASKHKEM